MRVTALAPAVGAEIEGVNLAGNLDAGLIADIRTARLEHLTEHV